MELELPSQTRQLLVVIQRDLKVNHGLFRQQLDESLGRAFGTTDRSTGTGQRWTTTHIDPDADESCIQFIVYTPTFLLARQHHLNLEILLGKDREFSVGIRFTVQPAPEQWCRPWLGSQITPLYVGKRKERGQSFGSQIVLIGLLTKEWATKKLGRDEAARVNLCRTFADLVTGHLHAREVMFFGRWERSPDPIGLYIEFSTPQEADAFGVLADSGHLRQEIATFCNSWFVADSGCSPDLSGYAPLWQRY
jgi:hypothetical protein